MSPTDVLLSRLDGVRKTGRGWIARCPAHEDRSPSLSIAAGEDGRVLLRCFGGCAAAEIVAAVGMEIADLFPQRMKPATPEQRDALRKAARESEWKAALRVLDREAYVVAIAASAIDRGEPLTAELRGRLGTALQRITDARAVLA